MIEESKYCSGVMKIHFNKELVMTKEDNEDFKNPLKCCICDNGYIDTDVRVKDHCHTTGKYRGFAHRDHNISSVKWGLLAQTGSGFSKFLTT